MDWNTQTLTPGHWVCETYGPLTILLLNQEEEWRLASWLNETPAVAPGKGVLSDLPSGIDWLRWDNAPADEQFQFRPSFPDLPLIARPNSPLWLAPQGKALFYLGIPVVIEVLGSFDGNLRALCKLDTQCLSKTWHGNRSSGNPCYTLRTRARRTLDVHDWDLQDIICAVDIVNQGSDDFHFQQLYLESDHLSIHEHDGFLWSNSCRVRIVGQTEKINEVIFTRRPQPPAQEGKEIAAPRRGHSRRGTFQLAFTSFIDALSD